MEGEAYETNVDIIDVDPEGAAGEEPLALYSAGKLINVRSVAEFGLLVAATIAIVLMLSFDVPWWGYVILVVVLLLFLWMTSRA
ncbi:hypothetical protein [Sicyoidochytrium minutum DNA virus]|nr:hypothetical protein [Sicyoidochytrium minutum DNA virus]